jgi:5,5'-dehydrodivanillate O-demethylase
MDDTHAYQWTVGFRPTEDGSEVDDEPEVEYLPPFKEPADAVHPRACFNLYAPFGQILAQDIVMWETQGSVSNRPDERLATSDKGITMLRDLMFEQIARVERGEDPMGVIRDPNHPMVDTNLEQSLAMHYPTGIVATTKAAAGANG